MKNFVLVLLLLSIAMVANADEIILTNGDRITGYVVEETDEYVIVDTRAMGKVTIDRDYWPNEEAQEAAKEEIKEPSDVEWVKKFNIEVGVTGGNTDEEEIGGGVEINRKTDEDEWTAKLDASLGRDEGVTDDRTYYGLVRYAYNFGDENKWFHFLKTEWEHDLETSIDYRITPATGIGYWFADEDNFKALAEIAAGYEHTNYKDSSPETQDEAILVPRAFIEKVIYNDVKFVADVTMYPSLSESGDYRLKAETSLVNPISEKVNLVVTFKDEYDSNPTGDKKKNDYTLTSGLEVEF